MTETKELIREDLKVGSLYRAKRFREFFGLNNDRRILWIGSSALQYDSHTVRDGRHYPTIDIDKFLRWASHEIKEVADEH